MKAPLERPQVEPPCRPSGIAARLHCVEPRQRVLAALGPHSREGGILMRYSTEDAEFRHGGVRVCRAAMPR
jgi:hypothetical protein